MSSIRSISTMFDSKTCLELRKTCRSITKLKQIHAQVIIRNFHKDIVVLLKLLAFTTHNYLNCAKKIFSTCCQNPTLFMCNVMIKGYVKTGQFKQPLLLFDELRIRGLCPDNFMYSFVARPVLSDANAED